MQMKNSNFASFSSIKVTRIDDELKLSGRKPKELGRAPRHDATFVIYGSDEKENASNE